MKYMEGMFNRFRREPEMTKYSRKSNYTLADFETVARRYGASPKELREMLQAVERAEARYSVTTTE